MAAQDTLRQTSTNARRRLKEVLDSASDACNCINSSNCSSALTLVPCGATSIWAAASAAKWMRELPKDVVSKRRLILHASAVWKYVLTNARLAFGNEKPGKASSSTLQNLDSHCAEKFFEMCRDCAQGTHQAMQEAQGEAGAAIIEAMNASLMKLQLQCECKEIPQELRPASEFQFDNHGQAMVNLSNGIAMPLMAFGTWELASPESRDFDDTNYRAVRAALAAGFRHLDCALSYGNENVVGRAIIDSGIPRQDLFIATKWSNFLMPFVSETEIENGFRSQLESLQTNYVDLYILHTPGSKWMDTIRIWRVLEMFHQQGLVRALGVSNFNVEQLEALFQEARVKPSYVQNKFSVYFPGEQQPMDWSVIEFCRERKVVFMAYSVVNAWPAVLDPKEDPHVLLVAQRYGRTAAQVLLRWALQLGLGVICRSTNENHIRSNLCVFDFKLAEEDMALLCYIGVWYQGIPCSGWNRTNEEISLSENSNTNAMASAFEGPWQPGMQVRVLGLRARPELNGIMCRLVEYDRDKKRWVVRAPNSQELLQIKPENLEKVRRSERIYRCTRFQEGCG